MKKPPSDSADFNAGYIRAGEDAKTRLWELAIEAFKNMDDDRAAAFRTCAKEIDDLFIPF